jgi:hypothetical protein
VLAATGDRRDVVLVAQSLAGFTAPLVAARRPVDAIVLVAAMVPAPGETGVEWWARWPAVPTRYLLCRDDRFFPADWAREHVRERLGIVPDELDSGHAPYLARPEALAAYLHAAAAPRG